MSKSRKNKKRMKDQQKIKTPKQKKPDLWVREEGRWGFEEKKRREREIKTRNQKKPDLWVRQEGRWSIDGVSRKSKGEREREREEKKEKKAYLYGSMGAWLFCTGGNGEIERRGGTREEL